MGAKAGSWVCVLTHQVKHGRQQTIPKQLGRDRHVGIENSFAGARECHTPTRPAGCQGARGGRDTHTHTALAQGTSLHGSRFLLDHQQQHRQQQQWPPLLYPVCLHSTPRVFLADDRGLDATSCRIRVLRNGFCDFAFLTLRSRRASHLFSSAPYHSCCCHRWCDPHNGDHLPAGYPGYQG